MEELVDLILKLNKEIIKEIPEINNGGCGVFALLMSKQLEKLGYKPTISILTGSWEIDVPTKKEVLNSVKNKLPINCGRKSDTSFAHCCIEVGGLIFDGEMLGLSFKDAWRRYPITGSYTIEELELSLKVGSWNSSYSRRKKNPTLRRIIRNAVKQVFQVEQQRYNYSL